MGLRAVVVTLEERQAEASRSMRLRRGMSKETPASKPRTRKAKGKRKFKEVASRKKPYGPPPRNKDKYCEVCLTWDPYVLDHHHIEPRQRGTRERVNGNHAEVVLCANCHVKCHRLFGGVSGRKYFGPDNKLTLILALRKERYKYRKKNPYVKMRVKIVTVPEDIKNKVLQDYNDGKSLRKIAAEYGISKSAVWTVTHGEKWSIRANRAIAIRKEHEEGGSVESLAEKYSVSLVTVRRIIHGATWVDPQKVSLGSSWRINNENVVAQRIENTTGIAASV